MRLDASGRGTPVGEIVQNVTSLASKAVTFNDNPTASVGIVHCDPAIGPLVPCAEIVRVSPAASGV